MKYSKAAVALAYALYDSESTGRLQEHPEDQETYFFRAEKILYMIHAYRSKSEKQEIIDEIQISNNN